ncbi:beta-lactamase/transpeptidase-like protein [Penicillium taxi]|uniref:beta-lactamase/transpeptidase-like protein n=1 Tax=Penicillium taxi TaxID=168475 RepID=UPI002544DD18|nr:beta-lactamase/transpeptidase-like protein [Penicillium taxi]KAJ5884700.1 beta-lactamase/transpeptidase-like protein [Penicillium taxi]
MRSLTLIPLIAVAAQAAQPAYCPLLGSFFPPPESISSNAEFVAALDSISLELTSANLTNSVSFQIFSGSDHFSAYKYSHTSSVTKQASHGVNEVDEDTVFRIGSGSKLWTMLLLMIETQGHILNERVINYVPHLRAASRHLCRNATMQADQADFLRWDEVTVGELASHLSGVARDYGFTDMSTQISTQQKLEELGFPALESSQIPPCGGFGACDKDSFFNGILKAHPLAPTSSTPIYSNAGFVIIGYILEHITGKSYERLLEEILIGPLNLTRSSYGKPDDKYGVIPGDLTSTYWNYNTGAETPAGGIYSSAKDMATFGRAILNHTLLPPTVTRRWMKPMTHTGTLDQSVGQPWEIFSLSTPRVFDLYTKAGDIGSYSSMLALSPDYNVGFVVLAAGTDTSNTVNKVSDHITDKLIPALEIAAKSQAEDMFTGSYHSDNDNSTITITTDSGPGLKVSSWIYNSHDMLQAIAALDSADAESISVRLYPTGLKNPGQSGFRAIIQSLTTETGGPFSKACMRWAAVDSIVYGNIGLDDFLFDLNQNGEVVSLSPRAFRQFLPKL